jgi:PHD/YefM family antitoxin component YafN of YafNO toxin-antitoxin module
MPTIVSARDIQRNYRKIFDQVKNSNPIFVLNNNQPEVAIIDIKLLERLYQKAKRTDLLEALQAVNIYQKEKQLKKLKKLNSLRDLT